MFISFAYVLATPKLLENRLKIKLENNYDISNWATSKVGRVPKKSDIRLKTKKKDLV